MKTLKKFYKFSKMFKFDINLHQAKKPTGVFNKYNKEKSNTYLHYKENKTKDDDVESLGDILEETELNVNTNLTIEEISLDDFLKESERFFNKLESAFKELIKYEKNIKFEKHQNHININTRVGVYILARENQTRLITLTSPLSGLFKYKYDPANNYWISIKDNHILNELLIREFCQHSGGLLIIDN